MYQGVLSVVQEYVDEAVANGSQPTADASDLARSTIVETRFGELQERAPVTCGDVEEVSKVLSEPADKVSKYENKCTKSGGLVHRDDTSLLHMVRAYFLCPSKYRPMLIVATRYGHCRCLRRSALYL